MRKDINEEDLKTYPPLNIILLGIEHKDKDVKYVKDVILLGCKQLYELLSGQGDESKEG